MKGSTGRVLAAVVVVMAAGACSRTAATPDDVGANHPAVVEKVDGSEGAKVTLTDKAIERIGLETVVVKAPTTAASRTIPNAAVLYDPEGRTWTYVASAHGTYVRTPIVVDHVAGDETHVSDGPPAGTEVVTTGAQELYGAESTFGED
jgi:hypothetical protein